MSFHELPDPLLKHVASFLPAKELCTFESLDKRTSRLDLYEAWEYLCEMRWQQWPPYQASRTRRTWMEENLADLNWKDWYIWVERDATRTRITSEELESVQWHFNFTLEAGGGGDATLCRCNFSAGLLFLPQYLPMPYRLEVMDGVQFLLIYHFPPHRIERLTNAGWLIRNSNVTFMSA